MYVTLHDNKPMAAMVQTENQKAISLLTVTVTKLISACYDELLTTHKKGTRAELFLLY